MSLYKCRSYGDELEIEADSMEEAAQEYVDGGYWGEHDKTTWVKVYVDKVWTEDMGEDAMTESDSFTIAIDPEEPECFEDEHVWCSPYSVLGGLKENPGVWGHGGGVIIKEVCANCGMYKITDTWAQNPENGEQGLESVQYKKANEDSLDRINPDNDENEE